MIDGPEGIDSGGEPGSAAEDEVLRVLVLGHAPSLLAAIANANTVISPSMRSRPAIALL
jgi:hypothetical protein